MSKRKNKFEPWYIVYVAICFSIGFLYGVNASRYHKLDKRIVALEQEIARQDCEKEAVSVGAGYVFIANGSESECYPLYSE